MRLLPRLFLLAVMLCPRLARAQDLPVYQAQAGLDGQIRIVGSDSMDPLVRLWTQEFQKLQPGVKFQISAHGSATAPPALARGEAELGTMSREMSLTEQEDFKAKLGCAPLGIVAAHDALAVFVHRRNPLPSIRLDHLDALYSVKRLTGYPWPIRTWRAFGVKRGWGRDPIRVYTRDGKSGSRALFAEKVLRKGGTMRPEVIEADQMGILDAIGTDIRALGYGPISYAGPQVRVVPLSPAKGQSAVPEILVKLRVFVDEQGRVRQTHIAEGASPGSRIEAAALSAARDLRLVPAMEAGKPVREWREVSVRVRPPQ